MSGSDDPNGPDESQQDGTEQNTQPVGGQPQGGQPGGGQPNSGQPRGGQPQGGQPRTNQPQGGQPQPGQPQPGRPPGGQQGGGVLDTLQQPEPSRYLKGIVAAMAAAAALLGVLVLLVGNVGGFPLLPEAVTDAQQQSQSSAAVGDAVSSSHQLLLAYLTAELAPFIAFVMAPLFGMLTGLRMSVPPRTKQVTAAAGTLAGSIVFVVVVTLFASFVVPEASDFGAAGMFATAQTGADTATGLGSIQFGNTIINGILVGLLAGATAFATTYSIDNFLQP